MDCEERLVSQAELVKSVNPDAKVWVYRNLVKALPWYSSVREKMLDPARGRNKQTPLATKNLLEDTDGLRRPPSKGGDAIHQCPLDAVALCFLLTCSLPMTSSRSEGLRRVLPEIRRQELDTIPRPAVQRVNSRQRGQVLQVLSRPRADAAKRAEPPGPYQDTGRLDGVAAVQRMRRRHGALRRGEPIRELPSLGCTGDSRLAVMLKGG